MQRGVMPRILCDVSVESGRGQPHSKTLRTEPRAIHRASVLECGCPLPLLVIVVLAIASAVAGAAHVELIRTPDGGIQPQAAVDNRGVVHLIYFKGEADGGDGFYVHRKAGEMEFSKPVKVNSRSGSVIAIGTIRGAQLAIGKNGRVHVVWDGMGKGATRVKINDKEEAPLLYTRLN